MTIEYRAFSKAITYRCPQGHFTEVPVASLRPGEVDLCGFGHELVVLDRRVVNQYRAMADLDPLEE